MTRPAHRGHALSARASRRRRTGGARRPRAEGQERTGAPLRRHQGGRTYDRPAQTASSPEAERSDLSRVICAFWLTGRRECSRPARCCSWPWPSSRFSSAGVGYLAHLVAGAAALDRQRADLLQEVGPAADGPAAAGARDRGRGPHLGGLPAVRRAGRRRRLLRRADPARRARRVHPRRRVRARARRRSPARRSCATRCAPTSRRGSSRAPPCRWRAG